MERIKKRKMTIILALLILIMVGWVIWENITVEINKLRVTSKNLPKAFNNFSIAHISDFHNSEYGKNNEKLIDILKSENPDIIVITGDFIDSRRTKFEIAVSFAQQAVKIAPCYYVTGNHEARLGSKYQELKTSLENVGVTVLKDEAIQLEHGEESIQLIGLYDPNFSEQDSSLSESILQTKLSQINISDGFTMLLSHRPEYFKVYQTYNIDLALTGHAHGGQFRLPFLGGLIAPGQGLFPKYDAGAYTENGTTMIVSRGVGNSLIPFRINNRPEIVIIELNCK